jgi:hypothetical protein
MQKNLNLKVPTLCLIRVKNHVVKQSNRRNKTVSKLENLPLFTADEQAMTRLSTCFTIDDSSRMIHAKWTNAFILDVQFTLCTFSNSSNVIIQSEQCKPVLVSWYKRVSRHADNRIFRRQSSRDCDSPLLPVSMFKIAHKASLLLCYHIKVIRRLRWHYWWYRLNVTGQYSCDLSGKYRLPKSSGNKRISLLCRDLRV